VVRPTGFHKPVGRHFDFGALVALHEPVGWISAGNRSPRYSQPGPAKAIIVSPSPRLTPLTSHPAGPNIPADVCPVWTPRSYSWSLSHCGIDRCGRNGNSVPRSRRATRARCSCKESPLEKPADGASCGRERGRMGQSLVWITDRGIRRRACSQCERRYTIPSLLTDPKANEVYDRLASPNRVTAELRTPVLTPGCGCGHLNGSSAEITNFYEWRQHYECRNSYPAWSQISGRLH